MDVVLLKVPFSFLRVDELDTKLNAIILGAPSLCLGDGQSEANIHNRSSYMGRPCWVRQPIVAEQTIRVDVATMIRTACAWCWLVVQQQLNLGLQRGDANQEKEGNRERERETSKHQRRKETEQKFTRAIVFPTYFCVSVCRGSQPSKTLRTLRQFRP